MKAALEFNLPDDDLQHQQAVNAPGMALALWDFDQWLRSEQKYADREQIEVDELREKLREVMGEYGLSFNMPMFR